LLEVCRKNVFFYSRRVKHCPCKRRGSRWFIVRAFGTLSTSEGDACFRKFAYIIKLRPMLRDSREWFVSLVKYFSILFFSLTTFFHPSPNLSTYIICLYNIYHTVALNAFTRDNICKRLFFLRRDAALGFNKTGHFSGDHLGISKEICRWLRKKYPNKSFTQKTFFIYATFFWSTRIPPNDKRGYSGFTQNTTTQTKI